MDKFSEKNEKSLQPQKACRDEPRETGTGCHFLVGFALIWHSHKWYEQIY